MHCFVPIAFGTERLRFPIPLPFGRLWYAGLDDAIGYAQFYSRSPAVIRVYGDAGDANRNARVKGGVQRVVSARQLY